MGDQDLINRRYTQMILAGSSRLSRYFFCGFVFVMG
jgi:hypothetical protein